MSRVVPLLALLALGACSSPAGDPPPAPPASSPAAPVETPAVETPAVEAPAVETPPAGEPLAEEPREERPPVMPVPEHLPAVVARVNGAEISRVEFEGTLKGIEASIGEPIPAEERDRIYREVLDELIAQRVLVQEALRNVTVPDSEVDQYIKELRSQFPSEDLFQQMLREQQLTLADLRSNLRLEMAVAKLLEEEIGDRVRPSADEVAEYYRENREQFRIARVRASQILFTVPPYADASARLRARQQAEAVVAQIRAGGDFAALARKQSQDPGSAARGGDLGYFEWGEMVEPLNEVVFRLQPETELEIVETAQGYHVMRVTERQPTNRVAPLQEVRPAIEDLLESINRQREGETFIDRLREESRIQIYF